MRRTYVILTLTALLCAFTVATGYATTASQAFVWTQSGGMRQLCTLGGYISEAYAINSDGYVAGCATTASGEKRAVIWDPNGNITDLGHTGTAVDINDNRKVIGYDFSGTGIDWGADSFTWTESEGINPFPTLGGAHCGTKKINNSNQVLALSQAASGGNYWVLVNSDGTYTNLGNQSYDLNNSGQTVGKHEKYWNSPYAQHYHWTSDVAIRTESNGTITEIGLPLFQDFVNADTCAYAINDNGAAAGIYNNLNTGWHGVIWQPNGTYSIFEVSLPGYYQFSTNAINNSGIVLGRSTGFSGTPARIWTYSSSEGFQDITATLGVSYIDCFGTDINNSGMIVGYYNTTVPEPSSVLALLCGIGGLGGFVIRKKK